MCISPIRIRNPNYGISHLKYKDTVSAFINVPCGFCGECVAIRQFNIVQRLQCEAINNHLFMATLTYNEDSMPWYHFSNGRCVRYADVVDVQNMMKRLRKYNRFGRPFRYFGVCELGSKRARPHFHIVFLVRKDSKDDNLSILNLEKTLFDAVLLEWRRNYGSRKHPDYRPLCTYVRKFVRGKLRSTFDLHYVRPDPSDGSSDNVAFYVSKYLCKPSSHERRLQQALHLNLPEDEYISVWSKIRPRYFASLGFGVNGELTPFGIEPDPDVVSHIRRCVDLSKSDSDFPQFFNRCTGQGFPLARYYKSKFYCFNSSDQEFFWNKSHPVDNVVIDDRDFSEKLLVEEKFSKRVSLIDSHDQSDQFDELF